MSYILDTKTIINMPSDAIHPVISELLSNYTYGQIWNIQNQAEQDTITSGDCIKAELGNAEYVINITKDGFYIKGANYSSLMRGYMAFLELIKYSPEKEYFYLKTGTVYGKPLMPFRCVHFCIFPETKLEFLRKCLRACAKVKYTHAIFEFWGMIKYDCMKELSWPFAHSKEQIRELVAEVNALGMEIIPMFNHLGHAAQCREINGKHVVLDQNPRYDYMFTSYGWVWNFKREDVRNLLEKVRDELIELCGKGKYFHIGCDEADSLGTAEGANSMADYINEVNADLKSKGRKTIMWHDMMLPKEDFKGYTAKATRVSSDILFEKLDRDILIADWQYCFHDGIWKTSPVFKEKGFDVVCCPWRFEQNVSEAIETVKENNLHGIIQTTWHELFTVFREMVYAGVMSYGTDEADTRAIYRNYCAEVARKTSPSKGDYKKCGWAEEMVGPGL